MEGSADKGYNNLLEGVLDRLPAQYRAVYEMREIERISAAETAALLDIAESSVVQAHRQAKTLVRNHLEDRLLEMPVFEFLGDRCDSLVRQVMSRITC